jgi:hypothetical protein
MKCGICYYTDNRCEERLANLVRKNLKRIFDGEIVSVSQYPIDFGRNIVVDLPRNSISLFKQIYEGVKASTADIIYLCEHDVIYHPSHFVIKELPENKIFYNDNRWGVDAKTGHCVFRLTKCTSLCVASKKLFMAHFGTLLNVIEKTGYHRTRMGFAPMTHRIDGVPRFRLRTYMSKYPCLDIRHATNHTPNRLKKEDFNTNGQARQWAMRGWKETDVVDGWGRIGGRFDEFLMELDRKWT